MFKSKVLVSFIIILYVLFAIFEFNGSNGIACRLDCFIIPVITLLYVLTIKNRNKYFTLFLLFYSFSDLVVLFFDFIANWAETPWFSNEYFIGNSLCVLAYIFLLVKIYNSLCISHVWKNFKIHIVVLFILNIYIIYVLQIIVKSNEIMGVDNYYLELVYNIVTFFLLSIALLNYFYKDNKKSLYLFIGVLCIVFSEVIDIAYIYIAQRSLLSVVAGTLSLTAFYFFYQQALQLDDKKEDYIYGC